MLTIRLRDPQRKRSQSQYTRRLINRGLKSLNEKLQCSGNSWLNEAKMGRYELNKYHLCNAASSNLQRLNACNSNVIQKSIGLIRDKLITLDSIALKPYFYAIKRSLKANLTLVLIVKRAILKTT